jgi:hypothetical protein
MSTYTLPAQPELDAEQARELAPRLMAGTERCI